MYIEKVSEVTEELEESMRQLVPQLGIHKTPPSREELAALIESESSTLFIARYPDKESKICGMLTLTIYRAPTGIRSIIEDVVVDEANRRRGIAQGLLNHAIEFARQAGADGISLTSNPRREAANLLYQAMGFKKRETNAYYYAIK